MMYQYTRFGVVQPMNYREEARQILLHLQGSAELKQHDVQWLADRLQALCDASTEEDLPEMEPIVVEPDVERLIRWRDSMALDWHGEELVCHVSSALRICPTVRIPPEHQAAHLKFLRLGREEQVEHVGAVLGWS